MKLLRGLQRSDQEKTKEALRAKAQRGLATGGAALGYTIPAEDGAKRFVIEPAQARLVERIFKLAAEGKGLLRIGHALNAECIPNTGKSPVWSSSTIREVLSREQSRGVITSGKAREVRNGGRKTKKVRVPEAEWLRVPATDLRIARWHHRNPRTPNAARSAVPGLSCRIGGMSIEAGEVVNGKVEGKEGPMVALRNPKGLGQ